MLTQAFGNKAKAGYCYAGQRRVGLDRTSTADMRECGLKEEVLDGRRRDIAAHFPNAMMGSLDGADSILWLVQVARIEHFR